MLAGTAAYAAPEVIDVQPSQGVLPRAGSPGTGSLLQILGTGFGRPVDSANASRIPTAIPSVLINGVPCDSPAHVSDS